MLKTNDVLSEPSLDHNWVGVVVVSVLASNDQRCHKTPDDRSVLELVSACANGYIEASQRGPVVNRDPVIGDVVKRTETTRTMRDAQRWDSTGQAEYLRIPYLRSGSGLVYIRIVYPVQRIAVWLRAADDQLSVEVRPEVCAQVPVHDCGTQLTSGIAARRRNRVNLLPQRAGSRPEFLSNACKGVHAA